MKNKEKLSDTKLIEKYEKGKIDLKKSIKPYLKKVKEAS